MIDSIKIYGKKCASKNIWICGKYPKCDSFVGTHPGTTKPLGTLANRELRNLRRECHTIIDHLWKEKIIRRGAVYGFLKWFMKLNRQPHIGEFDEDECIEFINRKNEIGEALAVYYKYRDY